MINLSKVPKVSAKCESHCPLKKSPTSACGRSKSKKAKISCFKKDEDPKFQSQSVEITKLQSQTPCYFPDVVGCANYYSRSMLHIYKVDYNLMHVTLDTH